MHPLTVSHGVLVVLWRVYIACATAQAHTCHMPAKAHAGRAVAQQDVTIETLLTRLPLVDDHVSNKCKIFL